MSINNIKFESVIINPPFYLVSSFEFERFRRPRCAICFLLGGAQAPRMQAQLFGVACLEPYAIRHKMAFSRIEHHNNIKVWQTVKRANYSRVRCVIV